MSSRSATKKAPATSTSTGRGRKNYDELLAQPEGWAFAAGMGFAGNEVSVKDLTAGYAVVSILTVTAGHQKQPFTLALEMSSDDLGVHRTGCRHGARIAVRRSGGRSSG